MAFDPYVHYLKTIIIKAAREIRKAKGLPEELNVSILYDEGCKILGIFPIITSTKEADQLPSPYVMGRTSMRLMNPGNAADRVQVPVIVDDARAEMIRKVTAKLLENKKMCPTCGKKSMEITNVCRSCTESEGGKYKSAWVCNGIRDDTGKLVEKGCGLREKTTTSIAQWYEKFGIDVGQGVKKEEVGTKTITDNGIV